MGSHKLYNTLVCSNVMWHERVPNVIPFFWSNYHPDAFFYSLYLQNANFYNLTYVWKAWFRIYLGQGKTEFILK